MKLLKRKDKLTFGKYRDWTVEQIFDEDPGYLLWLNECVDGYEVDQDILDDICEDDIDAKYLNNFNN